MISIQSPPEAPAMASTLSRLMTASAMAMVLTASQSVAPLSTSSPVCSSASRSLNGDPEQDEPAREPEQGHAEQRAHGQREDDAHGDRGGGAEHDAGHALTRRQGAAGERDDDGVVAGEYDVDADDPRTESVYSPRPSVSAIWSKPKAVPASAIMLVNVPTGLT